MSQTKKVLAALLLLFVGFVIYTLVSTGFFRTVENQFDGEVVKEIRIVGAEDITVDQEAGFAIISATNRKGFPMVEQEHGGLYFMDLNSGEFVLKHLTAGHTQAFAPHGISMFKRDSAYTIAAVNHTPHEHTIEFFELVGEELTHLRTERSDQFTSPNDIVLLDEERFYVTNDHRYESGFGRFMEDYGNLAVSNVLYFDGENYTEVAEGIAFANGINYDAGRNILFVSSPRRFLIKVYATEEDGSLAFVEDIPCGTGVDNIEFDTNGDLWVGCHPNLLKFADYAKGGSETTPSEVLQISYRSKGDYSVKSVYTNDGSELSGTSVAAPFNDLLLIGTVKDDKMLVLGLPEKGDLSD